MAVWERDISPAQTTTYAWVHDYVHELLTFPNAAHDDQVDATTLALNQLRGPLFQGVRQRVVETKRTAPST